MKKIIFCIPTIIFTVVFTYFAFGTSVDVTLVAWMIDVLLIVAGALLCMGKWWGGIFGIIAGLILTYMGLQETGQIFKEYFIGIPLVTYYMVCSCYTKK